MFSMDRLVDHLEKLRPFATIAQLGSLHRAAARLRTSQPALTQMLKTLEGDLGTQLFSRTSRGMVLTDAGEKLHEFAKTLLRQTSEFQFGAATEPKTIRLATYESLADLIVLRLEDFPEASHYHFTCHVSGLKLIDLLVGGDTDYILLAEPPKVAGVRFEKLVETRYGLFATKEYKLRHGPFKASTVVDEPLIFVPGSVSSTTGIIDRFVSSAGLGQKKRLTVNSYIIAKTLTLAHHGVGVLVNALVARELREGRLVEIELDGSLTKPVTSLYLGCREGQEARQHYTDVKRAIRSAFS